MNIQAALALLMRRKDRDGDWHPDISLTSKKLVTGEYSSPPEVLMQRRENGVTIYRRPTVEEANAYLSTESW